MTESTSTHADGLPVEGAVPEPVPVPPITDAPEAVPAGAAEAVPAAAEAVPATDEAVLAATEDDPGVVAVPAGSGAPVEESLAEEPDPAPEPPSEPAPAAAPAAAGDRIDGLTTAVEHLDARLEESQRLHARQSDLVDRLHAENQALKRGELRAAQLPLIRDLLRMHDDIGRVAAAAEASAAEDLEIVREALVETLARNGVSATAPAPGEPFDPRSHNAAGVEPTSDPSLDRCVASTLRSGFAWDDGALIRAAEVRVHKLRPPEAQLTTSADDQEEQPNGN